MILIYIFLAALQSTRQSGPRPKTSYTSIDAISQNVIPPQNYGSKKRSSYLASEDDYFDDDDNADNNLEYIPGPNSPAAMKKKEDYDSEDELDKFMAGLEQTQTKPKNPVLISSQEPPTSSQNKGVRADIDDMDDEESYYKYMEENPNAGVIDENSGDELEYDEDGNPIAPAKKRFIDPLPPIDHSEIKYEPFEKNFYAIHDEIAAMNKTAKDELRHKLGIKVSGASAPAPVCSFAHFGFDETLMKAIRKSEYVSVINF